MGPLPITEFRERIVQAIQGNQVVLIEADTGAGKSTQVPQYLLAAGFEVIVTQPRRIAAKTVAERVAFEHGTKIGNVIGYRTAFESQYSRNTKCLFVTDGLMLVRALIGSRKRGTVLIIDELHEWNLNIEVLVAYVKRQVSQDKELKVVLMSATMESAEVSAYFGGAPVIKVPGRLFPIEDRNPGQDIVTDAERLLACGRNVLVFVQGKGEIDETMTELRQRNPTAVILPLHSQLTPEEQHRCFQNHGRPKCVVATNVAQTSITIPDITAVVDSGFERRKVLVDGVEGLKENAISYADREQRRGRCGRVGPGIYIDHCSVKDRLLYAVPEINARLLDQTVLRLAVAGFNAEEFEFFHQPDRAAIHAAKESLKLIGCMDPEGRVTEMGERVSRLPVSVKYGRMIIEANKLGVLSDVLTIVAIFECEGIIDPFGPWRTLCQDEQQSDLLAQLRLYKTAHGQGRKWCRENGIHVKQLYRAQEIRGHIVDSIQGEGFKMTSNGDRELIIRSVFVGLLEHVFCTDLHGSFTNGQPPVRQLSRDTVLHSDVRLLVGLPFNLEIKPKEERPMSLRERMQSSVRSRQQSQQKKMLRLINLASEINVKMLLDLAPHLITKKTGLLPRFDPALNEVVSNTQVSFRDLLLVDKAVPDPNHADAPKIRALAKNEEVWTTWEAPAGLIASPNVTNDRDPVPEVVTANYGICALTGNELVAHGTVAIDNGEHSYGGPPVLIIKWTRDPEEAEAVHDIVVRRLEDYRKAYKAQKEEARVAPIRRKILALYNANLGNQDMVLDLRQRLIAAASVAYGGAHAVFERLAELEALAKEVETALTAIARKKLEPAKLEKGKVARSFADL